MAITNVDLLVSLNTVKRIDSVYTFYDDIKSIRKDIHCESKNFANLTMAITLSILNQFVNFVHCCKERQISIKTHISLTTTP